jgi:hypothetical protein
MPMDSRRVRFLVALVFYLTWVISLSVMAVFSGQQPIHKSPASAPR